MPPTATYPPTLDPNTPTHPTSHTQVAHPPTPQRRPLSTRVPYPSPGPQARKHPHHLIRSSENWRLGSRAASPPTTSATRNGRQSGSDYMVSCSRAPPGSKALQCGDRLLGCGMRVRGDDGTKANI